MPTPDPIFMEIATELVTPRLHLRIVQPGDGGVLHTAVHANQTHLHRWMPWALKPMDEKEYEVYARRQYAKFLEREEFQFLIWLPEEKQMIGSVGCHHVAWDVPKMELGYWLTTDGEGHGFMTEAVTAVTAWGFNELGMQRIQIQCASTNERSASVARRCGYTQEAHFRHNRRDQLSHELGDTLLFSRLATD
jgi:ribosomal-protein-serine acetyltransferase